MTLISFEFIAFVSVVFFLNLISNGNCKKVILLLANLIFILLYGNFYHAAWIFGVAIYLCFAGYVLKGKKSKMLLTLFIVPIVFSLLFFKYGGYFHFKNIFMPLGISFTTFRAIGYLVDLYSQKCSDVGWMNTLVYLSFFPAVTAGPIQSMGEFAEQLNKKINFDYNSMKNAAVQCAFGMFQKLVFADYLAGVCSTIFTSAESHGILLIGGAVLYSFQLYLDFDGYSNIAIGVSKLFGIEMKKNFNTPYLAQSIMEFWDRWHISLSTWLKKYIYIPLGGNRKGLLRKYINILIVFIISGIWHGSTSVFLIWGIGHGVVNIIENVLADAFKQVRFFTEPGLVQRWVKKSFNFVIVTILWVFFRSADLNEAFSLFGRMMILDRSSLNFLALGITIREVVWIAIILLVTFVTDLMRNKTDMVVWLSKRHFLIRWCLYILLVFIALVFGAYGPGHNAADFIYASF